VLPEEFPDAEHSLIVVTFRTIACKVNKARGCFQTPKLLIAPGAELNQICNHTSAVDGCGDLLSAMAPTDDRAAIPLLFDDTRSRLWHGCVLICVVPFPLCLRSRFKAALPDSVRRFPSDPSRVDSSPSAGIHHR
jgi:hypothetical protein